ncbi:unnamed protein product [Prorocentrum cordatum]|uniref:Alpha-galactosidase n=1 Tax=Prorocentrum cordatum TaxID=2364126 RepID=A0ABN9WR83_9DINO|nr:unnamed protein product [Polarella glacialis]
MTSRLGRMKASSRGDPRHAKLLSHLRKEPMCEEGALRRVAGFKELTGRGVALDSFLWDDGWDDPYALWEFNRTRFPRGFSAVAEKAKELGAGLGVWLSPWGGYGSAKEERVRLGKEQGFEVNEHGLSLAGPKYAARFGEAVQKFRRESRVNMFKFDGVAGDPKDLPAECEAILELSAAVREESRRDVGGEGVAGSEVGGAGAAAKGRDPFWINLTTGTWPSPFFLLWVPPSGAATRTPQCQAGPFWTASAVGSAGRSGASAWCTSSSSGGRRCSRSRT